MSIIRAHEVQWVTAAPLWPETAQPAVMQRPAILRFDNDDFMEELAAQLADKEKRAKLGDYVAAPGKDGEPAGSPLKLYQPAHGRFYLVAANIVCRLPGLPDHSVDLAGGDVIGFVLRRITAGDGELALVGEEKSRRWQAASDKRALVTGEEILPLSPVAYSDGDRRRRMLAGLVPVSRQDALMAAGLDAAPAPAPDREELLERVKGSVPRVIAALQQAPAPDADATLVMKEASRFAVLDLAEFLRENLLDAWNAITAGGAARTADVTLVSLLKTTPIVPGSTTLWKDALADVWTKRDQVLAGNGASVLDVNLRQSTAGFPTSLENALRASLEGALPAPPPPPAPVKSSDIEYVVRCVYRRSRCGALKPVVVSPESDRFRLANFFDVDAPGRPIRIALPADTSLGALRKLRKNVAVILSQKLKDKIQKATDFKDDKPAPGVGFDCGGFMFSIPIITICALIVLMIFLNLLNIIFWWLPLIKICLPKVRVE